MKTRTKHIWFIIITCIFVYCVLEYMSYQFLEYYELHNAYEHFRNSRLNKPEYSTWKKHYRQRKADALKNQMMVVGNHLYFGYTYNPGFTGIGSYYFDTENPDAVTSIQINTYGFKDKDFHWKKEDGVFRILCLGGSTTSFGSSIHTTYPALLQEKLGRYLPEKNIEVINAGTAGYKVWNSLRHYMLRLYELEPNLIIVYHAINDVKYNHHPADLVQQQKNYPPPSRNIFRHALAFFIEHSYTVKTLHLGYSRLKSTFFPKKPTLYNTVSEEGVLAFEKQLESLILLAQARKTPVVLLNFQLVLDGGFTPEEKHVLNTTFQSYCMHSYDDGLTKEAGIKVIQAYNKSIQQLANQYNIYFVDMSHAVPQTKRYFMDCVHRSDEGNSIFADILAKHLLTFDIFQSDVSSSGTGKTVTLREEEEKQ